MAWPWDVVVGGGGSVIVIRHRQGQQTGIGIGDQSSESESESDRHNSQLSGVAQPCFSALFFRFRWFIRRVEGKPFLHTPPLSTSGHLTSPHLASPVRLFLFFFRGFSLGKSGFGFGFRAHMSILIQYYGWDGHGKTTYLTYITHGKAAPRAPGVTLYFDPSPGFKCQCVCHGLWST